MHTVSAACLSVQLVLKAARHASGKVKNDSPHCVLGDVERTTLRLELTDVSSIEKTHPSPVLLIGCYVYRLSIENISQG